MTAWCSARHHECLMNKRCGPCLAGAHSPEGGREKRGRENKQKIIGRCSNPYNRISLGALDTQDQSLEVWEPSLL